MRVKVRLNEVIGTSVIHPKEYYLTILILRSANWQKLH
jgi:hypothetical protein